jgi:4-hydroxy-tetrahydrodipicolinate synthase
MRFEGVYTPVVTPFRSDFSIHRDALAETVEHLVASGVHGIVVAGTTGEYYAQTTDERLEVMRFVRDAIGGRVALIVGTGAIRTEDSIAFAEAAKAVGADAILVATPPYAYPTGREIALHALAIDRAANLPVMLYNYPGRMGVNMDEETLDRLGRSPNFCAIKESSGSPDRLHMLARDYPHIQLYRTCAVEGDFAKGRRIMSAMLPLMRVLEQGGKFVQCIKHGLSLRGIDAGPPRRPLQPLNKERSASWRR